MTSGNSISIRIPNFEACPASVPIMRKAWAGMILLSLFAVPAGHAADNMKAFPPAAEGMLRYVLRLPAQADESALKVELMVGKTVKTDAGNRYFFGGRIEVETIKGWTAGAEVKAIEPG